jgi:hypothetical protein
VLARTKILQRFYYYFISIVTVNPFPKLSFNPLLPKSTIYTMPTKSRKQELGGYTRQATPDANTQNYDFNKNLQKLHARRWRFLARRWGFYGRRQKLVARRQELVTRRQKLAARRQELVTRRQKLAARRQELVAWGSYEELQALMKALSINTSLPSDIQNEASRLPQRTKSAVPSQNSIAYTEYGGWGQGDVSKSTTSPTGSDYRTSRLPKALQLLLQVALTYLALSKMPVALAQEDHDVSQTSTQLNWFTTLFLMSAAGIAGHKTKKDLFHASGFSAFMVCVIAVIWDQLDPATKVIAAAVGLSPWLAVAWDQIWEGWRLNDFHEQGEEVYPNAESHIRIMEEGDLDAQDDDNYDSHHWTSGPGQLVNATESSKDAIEDASRTDQYKDREGSPEPWNGTEGFQR